MTPYHVHTQVLSMKIVFFNFRKCASILRTNIYFCVFRFKRIHTCQKILSRNSFFYLLSQFLYLRLHRSRSGQVMFHPCILLDWIDHKWLLLQPLHCIQKSKMQRNIAAFFSHVLSISSTRVVVYIISFPNQVLL